MINRLMPIGVSFICMVVGIVFQQEELRGVDIVAKYLSIYVGSRKLHAILPYVITEKVFHPRGDPLVENIDIYVIICK